MMRGWLPCLLVAVWNGSSLSALAWQPQTPPPFSSVAAHKRARTTTTSTTTTTQLFTTTSTHVYYSLERRRLLQATAASLLGGGTTSWLLPPSAAHAGGLLQFPIQPSVCPLKNKYHFMRAGPSELEMQGIYSTNPLFLTNRENAMHPSGEAIILQALEQIRKEPPTIAYHSLAANGMDTGDLIARELNLGREKLLPEFTYLDPRGIGMWNDGDESLVKPAIFALDNLEAGERGMNGRPPSNIDGTPNETLNDQFIRLRQFLSLQESRTAGDVILVIFPDGTGPALLSCMIAGIPYEDCHALEFEPGEVRLDITPDSVKKLFEEKKNDPHYLEILEQGKEELKILRQQEGKGGVSLKELRENKVQADIEQAYQDKKKADTALEIEKRKAQEERQRQIQVEYQEERRRSKPSESSSSKQVPAWKQQQQASNPSSISAVSGDASSTTTKLDTKSFDLPMVAGLSAAGAGAVGLMAMGATNNNDGVMSKEGPPDAPSTTQKTPPVTASLPAEVAATVDDDTIMEPEKDPVDDFMSTTTLEQEAGHDNTDHPMVDRDPLDQPIWMDGDDSSTTKSVEDALEELATAEQAMKDALVEAADQKSRQQGGSLFDAPVPTISTTRPKSVEEMIDDGADDWLRIMAEIRDEEDVEENTSMVINGSGDLYDQ